MERQLKNKKAATDFTSAAFSNIISGLGGSGRSSAIVNQFIDRLIGGTGATNIFNPIDKE